MEIVSLSNTHTHIYIHTHLRIRRVLLALKENGGLSVQSQCSRNTASQTSQSLLGSFQAEET